MTTTIAFNNLERLQQLYTAGFQDTFLDNALRKVIERQLERDETDLQRVNAALAEFERQYGLRADEFWQKYQNGQLTDSADFMEWNAFCKMRQRLTTRLKILRGRSA
jgi:hypothetical protein